MKEPTALIKAGGDEFDEDPEGTCLHKGRCHRENTGNTPEERDAALAECSI